MSVGVIKRRFAALLHPCPACGSPAGVGCAGKRGERKALHRERRALVDRAAIAAVKRKFQDDFYSSKEWRIVRYQALRVHGGKCQCCGARPQFGSPLHVDHVKPRSRFPELELDVDNLQVLCEDCNLGKGNSDTIDWRAA